MIQLIDRKEILVRFSEVDSMRIVWHGNYLKYFEDGREAFGLKYNLGYLDVYKHNVMIPIVKVNCYDRLEIDVAKHQERITLDFRRDD